MLGKTSSAELKPINKTNEHSVTGQNRGKQAKRPPQAVHGGGSAGCYRGPIPIRGPAACTRLPGAVVVVVVIPRKLSLVSLFS